jgi:hypothetical protein
MDVWRLLAAAARRWYVLVLLGAVAAGVAWSVSSQVPPEYTATSSVLLVPPVASSSGNPYGDLGTATQSLVIILQTPDVRGKVIGAGGVGAYEVTAVSRTPILQFVARAERPQAATATVTALLEQASGELADRQAAAGVDVSFRVGTQILDSPNGVAESSRNRQQALVIWLGVGLVMAFIASVFVDDLVLLARRRRRTPPHPIHAAQRRQDALEEPDLGRETPGGAAATAQLGGPRTRGNKGGTTRVARRNGSERSSTLAQTGPAFTDEP